MKRAILLFAILSFAFFLAACRKSEPSLSLLVWEGYADPSFIKAFEDAHHCKVVAAYMGSSDELVAKLRGGSAGNYDVISPSSDVATSIVRAGLAAPIDLCGPWFSLRRPDSLFVAEYGSVIVPTAIQNQVFRQTGFFPSLAKKLAYRGEMSRPRTF